MNGDAGCCLRKIFYVYGFKALEPAENLISEMHACGQKIMLTWKISFYF